MAEFMEVMRIAKRMFESMGDGVAANCTETTTAERDDK